MVENNSCHMWASIILLEDQTRSMKVHERLNVRNKDLIPVPGCSQIAIDDHEVGAAIIGDSSP